MIIRALRESRAVCFPLFVGMLAFFGCEKGRIVQPLEPGSLIDDLRVETVADSSVVLVWRVPTESESPILEYDLRFSTEVFEEPEEAAPVPEYSISGPGQPGSVDSIEVIGLEPGTNYYFGLGYRNAGGWSPFSNIVPVRTHLDPPFEFVLSWGEEGEGPGQFLAPSTVAIGPDRSVYVSDAELNSVQRFSDRGDYLGGWGGASAGWKPLFTQPKGIAIASSGEIVVINVGEWNVFVLSPTGTLVRGWHRELKRPLAVAVHDGIIYVSDQSQIWRFLMDNTQLETWGIPGSGDGEFSEPWGLCFDADGNLLVADSGNHRIQKLSPTGEFLTSWGTLGSGDGELDFPRGIAVGPGGAVYVADSRNARIQKFSPDGAFIKAWGQEGEGPGEFIGLYGIATDSREQVYGVDVNRNEVQVFTSDGIWVRGFGEGGAGTGAYGEAWGITVDQQDNVYVVDRAYRRIQIYSRDAIVPTAIIDKDVPPQEGKFANPSALAIDNSGKVYVSDYGNRRIQVFQADGSFVRILTQFPVRNVSILLQGLAVEQDILYSLNNSNIDIYHVSGDYLGFQRVSTESHRARAVASSSEKSLVLAYNGAPYIKVYQEAQPLYSWGETGTAPGHHSRTGGVAVDGNGFIYVTDHVNHRIQVFDGVGVLRTEWGIHGDAPGNLNYPDDIAVDPDRNVYVVNAGNHRIEKFSAP